MTIRSSLSRAPRIRQLLRGESLSGFTLASFQRIVGRAGWDPFAPWVPVLHQEFLGRLRENACDARAWLDDQLKLTAYFNADRGAVITGYYPGRPTPGEVMSRIILSMPELQAVRSDMRQLLIGTRESILADSHSMPLMLFTACNRRIGHKKGREYPAHHAVKLIKELTGLDAELPVLAVTPGHLKNCRPMVYYRDPYNDNWCSVTTTHTALIIP